MLRNSLENIRLVLASGSPRRHQFLRDLDLDFEIRLKEVDEIYPPELAREQITEYLAILKASAFAGELATNEILVTSDTIVWHRDRALGKPVNYQHAVEMLGELSGSTHQVFTSVCLSSHAARTVFSEETKVTFSPISQDSIHYYLDNFKPFDKAGSYGIQDWLGLTVISRIEGSYTNVVGLPTERFSNELSAFALREF